MKDQGFKELLDEVYNTGKPFIADERPITLKRKGKLEEAYVKFIYEPLREEDGSYHGVMALAHEITGQVVARKRMEAQALMVHNMLMAAPAFVCTLGGPDHVYKLVNPRYQQLFGTRKIQGLSIKEALPELEGQGFYELLDKVYNTGEVYLGLDVPIILGRDDATILETRFFNLSYQPMYDENKNIYSILVFGYEVTNQVNSRNRYLEKEKKLAKRLEVEVKQRTLELIEKNKELEQKNHEIAL
jgi:PAS domain-containing protein